MNLQEILTALTPGVTLTDIDHIESRGEMDIDTVRVLDARTTRVYTLLPPALGGIVSTRDLGGGSAHDVTNTDTWYAYDRLGSVMLTADAAGTPAALRWQDAYGNELASELTGSWATPAAGEGYGLTTKWYDGDVEMYYFWQRWEEPEVAAFASRAPYSAYSEHPYSYANGNPLIHIDPAGQRWRVCCRTVDIPNVPASHCFIHFECAEDPEGCTWSLFASPDWPVDPLGQPSRNDPRDATGSACGPWQPGDETCIEECGRGIASRPFPYVPLPSPGIPAHNSNTFAREMVGCLGIADENADSTLPFLIDLPVGW